MVVLGVMVREATRTTPCLGSLDVDIGLRGKLGVSLGL